MPIAAAIAVYTVQPQPINAPEHQSKCINAEWNTERDIL